MSFDRNKLKDIKFRHHNTLLYAKELFNAINDFYKTEDDYFAKVDGREQSVVFRIAHKLASKIEDGDIFVDCEANRCNGRIKEGAKGRIRPDLIIHERNSTSYVAVEFKTSKRYIEYDYDKLKELTSYKDEHSNENSPTYDLGVSILLGNDKVKEVKCFVNGKEYKFDDENKN